MVCEQILGNLTNESFCESNVDYVEIEWFEAFKKLHKKTTRAGEEIGIRMDNHILRRGLKQGDVLYHEGDKIIAVDILPCSAIIVQIDKDHTHMVGKVCYEIGNRHAALFWGDDDLEFITPYNEPMLTMLKKIHGVTAWVKTVKLDFTRSISSSVNAHTH